MKTKGRVQDSRTRRWVLAACAIVVVAGLAFGLAGCSCASSEQGKETKKEEKKTEEKAADVKNVPNIVGMTKDDAARVIADAGFKVGTVTEEESESVAIGMVVNQKPKSSEQVKPGSNVDYVVSKGVKKAPKQVAVPDLARMTQTQAEDALAKLHLVAKAGDPVYQDGVEAGKIFKQSVAAGTTVEEGSEVVFVVALGREVVAVPSVINQTKDSAIKTLSGAAFNIDVVELYSSDTAAGNVISQNPNPKIQCVKGTTVTLFVSKGAAPAPTEQVIVPDLTTLTYFQAKAVCKSAGLSCKYIGEEQGFVVSQSIAPGTKVDRGTTITVTLELLQ